MSVELIVILGILYYIVTVIALVVILNLLNNRDKKNYRRQLDELEKHKNLIISATLIAELKKVEPLIDNSNMKDTLKKWHERYESLKEDDVSRITDSLIEAEDLYEKRDYKALSKLLSEIELDIYFVNTKANFLLDEIKEITLSEERNRETITKLKTTYREILSK